jgi:hypothetical protein
MTIEEVQAKLAEYDNEIAAHAQTERQCVEQVRYFADGRRNAAAKRAAVELAAQPLRDLLREHVVEQRRLAAEKAKAEAEAKAKAEAELRSKREAEAAEAKAKEAGELEVAKARIAELEAAAAKG